MSGEWWTRFQVASRRWSCHRVLWVLGMTQEYCPLANVVVDEWQGGSNTSQPLGVHLGRSNIRWSWVAQGDLEGF
jgi:hypothetical protein